MEAITASSIDIAVPGAPLTIRRDDKVIAFTDVVREEMSSRPDGYWATQVDVRGVNYTVQVTPNQRIDTLASLFSSAAKKGDLHVLRDINFSLLPFETTVLLGRPRSGKTSLLDVLGFRRRGSIEGSVTVNGAPNVANYHRLVSYIQQGDVHLPMLTAKETLAFSANCQLDDRTKVDRKVDEVLQLLSLKHAENTIVGSDVVRGLSGGEKRRVSIGVEMVKESSLVLLDEPTTGLDSGAAYQVGQAMRALSARGTPVLAALLQPSWELVKLFDKVIVLSEGEIGYWGPVSEALSYFDSLGYSCPAHYSAAEFLAEVVDYPDRFPMDPERPRTAYTRAELIAAYRASDMHARMLAQAKASAERMNAEKKTHQDFQLSSVTEATHAAKYPRSRWEQFDLLLRRGLRNYARDWRREVESIVAMFVVSVITGLLFLQRGDGSSGSVSKLGLIFLLVLRGAFEALGGIVNLFIALPTFYRQRAGHYHAVLPWVLSSFCVGVPAMVVQSVAYPTIVYWMAGLRPDAGAYFFLIATCIVITLCFVAYVRIWGCLLPDPFMSALVATVTSGILIVFSGYLVQRARMPAAWRWVYFLSPFSYAFNAAAISEFAGADIKCRASELMPPADTLNFLAAYPVGYEGRQVCPFSDGNDFLAQSGLYTDKRLQGVFFLISVVWMCVFIALFYVVIRFVDYSDFRMTTGKDDVSRKLAPADAKLKGSAHAAMLSWENLTYTVPVKGGQKTILSNVHGYVKPGMLLALMGASGAGKTTLLDVLAQRKNVGKVTGTVLLDGRAPDEAYRRLVGYVEQTDMHFAQQTVLEALSFAAECRLPSNITAEQRRVIVTNVLDLLNLRSIAGAYIGYGGQAGGINAEERKRLSMGVELVAQPAILFLDEPTSGLDSNAADVVMSAIQNVAQSGTSVICTIHQPSSRIFNRATHLLLLKKGGQVVYFGEVDSAHGTLLAYMERHGVRPTPGQNPADLVLAASLGKAGRTEDEMLNAFVESPEARHVLDTIHEVAAHPPQPSPEYARLLTELRKSYATSFGREFVLHLRRWLMNYWRGPLDVLVAVVRAVTLGFICGTVYWNRPMDALGVAERFSVLFFSSLYADLTAFAYLPMVFFQRPIFYRERSERMYRTATYALGYIVADLPMMFLGTLCFTITFYFFTGLQRTIGHFAFYLLMSQLNTMVSVMYVQLIGSIFAKSDTGGVIYGSASLILATAAGFLIPQRDIPKVVRWISRISFSSYFMQSVAISEFTGSTYHCAADSALYVPINDTVTMPYCDVAVRGPLEILSIDSDVQWVGVGALAGFYVLFAVAYILCLQFINHVKR